MGRTVTLPINIGCGGGRTLQEEIYSSIRRSIVDGLVGEARRLPSTRALAAELGVSRTTVTLALEHLQAEGYLVSRRGSGTFIAEELPDSEPRTRSQGATRKISGHRGTATASVTCTRDVKRPSFSLRGRALAEARAPDRRGRVPNRAFRMGTPALDLFPLRLWSRMTHQCVRAFKTSQLDYSARAGLQTLREGIAEQVRSRGTKCDPKQVIVVAGAQRALDLVFHLLLDPGDLVWMEEPGYTGAQSAFVAAGASITLVPVDAHGIDIPYDIRSSRHRQGQHDARLAYVTPSHQFPLGVVMSLDRRQNLLAWANRSRSWIVEDDYDCDFRWQVRPLPCLHALDADDRVIYVGTFSKTLFPAIRMGFLIAPHDLAEGVASARLASDVHPPVLEQAVLAEFMARGHYQRHLRRMRAVYMERLDALEKAIRHCGAPLRLRPVHTGLHAVVDLDGVDAERVFREAAARDIEVMPLSHYYFGGGPRQNGLVLGFASVQPAVIRAAVTQLAVAIEVARRAVAGRRMLALT